jgi:hypothetical protein
MTIEIILIVLSPIFFMFISYEFVKHRHYYDIKDSLANTALALMHQGAEAIALLVLMPFFYWLYEYRLFDIDISVISIFFCFHIARFFILLVSQSFAPHSLVMGCTYRAS